MSATDVAVPASLAMLAMSAWADQHTLPSSSQLTKTITQLRAQSVQYFEQLFTDEVAASEWRGMSNKMVQLRLAAATGGILEKPCFGYRFAKDSRPRFHKGTRPKSQSNSRLESQTSSVSKSKRSVMPNSHDESTLKSHKHSMPSSYNEYTHFGFIDGRSVMPTPSELTSKAGVGPNVSSAQSVPRWRIQCVAYFSKVHDRRVCQSHAAAGTPRFPSMPFASCRTRADDHGNATFARRGVSALPRGGPSPRASLEPPSREAHAPGKARACSRGSSLPDPKRPVTGSSYCLGVVL